jgi:hypothetical protein
MPMLVEGISDGRIAVRINQAYTEPAIGQVSQLFGRRDLHPQPYVGHGDYELWVFEDDAVSVLFIGETGRFTGALLDEYLKTFLSKLVGARRIQSDPAFPVGLFPEHCY